MSEYRDAGCRGCRAITSGDCGRHGPMIMGSVSFGPPGTTQDHPFILKPSPATDLTGKVKELERQAAENEAAIVRLTSAIKWALGEEGEFSRPRHVGAYWWRTELRKRAGLATARADQATGGA